MEETGGEMATSLVNNGWRDVFLFFKTCTLRALRKGARNRLGRRSDENTFNGAHRE